MPNGKKDAIDEVADELIKDDETLFGKRDEDFWQRFVQIRAQGLTPETGALPTGMPSATPFLDQYKQAPPREQWSGIPYSGLEIPFQTETGEEVTALLKPDYTLWAEGAQIGSVNPETGEFIQKELPWYQKALGYGLKGLEWAVLPFATWGNMVMSIFKEEMKPGKILAEEHAEIQEIEDKWKRGELDWWTAEKLTLQKSVDCLAQILPGGKVYEAYREQPWWQQLLAESPSYLAAGAISATSLRAALVPAVARGGVVGGVAQATRVGLTPIAGVEKGIAVGLRYGIGFPLKYGVAKPLEAGARKAFETALDKGLDRWILRQAVVPEQSNKLIQYFIQKNNYWLYERAQANWIKRIAEKRGVQYTANQAATDTIKEAEPLLLQVAKELGIEVKPTARVVTPPKPTEVIKPPVALEAVPKGIVVERADPALTSVKDTITGERYYYDNGWKISGTREAVPQELVAGLDEAVKAFREARIFPEALIKPPPVTSKVSPEIARLVARRTELGEMLAKPATQLPKGMGKIVLRQELKAINAKLVPAEKKLRQRIMATVKTNDLSQSQYREIFRKVGGSRWLSQVNMERLPSVLEAVRTARPVSIGGKKVITPKVEQDLQVRKAELIDEGIFTEEAYKDILKDLNLPTDKYVNKALFITQSQAHSILGEMNNRAILAPLGELKFAKPTAISNLTSDTYYSYVLGVKPLTEPLELAKIDFDLAFRALSRSIDEQINKVNKAFGISAAERLLAKTEGRPTKGVAKLRDLLDKFEEAPAELTKEQKTVFNWFRNLNQTIIDGENQVRRGLGMPEIAYREAYVRHVPDSMAEEILRGLHPLPPGLEYWSQRIVSKKIFNPMEFHRQLSDDLARLYTKDLAQASKNMVYTGLKEIHFAQPLKTFNKRMGALSDVMPASTRRWVIDFINQRIKGQQTEWDASLNRLVTESGFGGLMNNVLSHYRLSLGTRPVTKLAQAIGKGTILAVLGLPRPRLARLLIRNLFQRTQELALHNPISVIKGFAFESGTLKNLMDKSRFLRAYTGVEEWPADLMGKLTRIPLAPYQSTAVINARQAMRTTYYDTLPFFTNPKYTNLGWASPKRTYTEAKGFLYPEEETTMLGEMELAARATQYQYIGLGMPKIFRNQTLIPLTRLQSWWMNYFFMFHKEAAHRFLYGTTRLGHKLPWSKRVNYLIYLLLGGAILTSMGYGMSYLWRVLPYNLSPVGQFMIGLFTYVSASSDWQREKGRKEIYSAWKAMVPGPLAYDEFEKLWSGEMPLWQMFFYGREEEEVPPRLPTWNIINRQPAIDKKTALRDIGEAIEKLGTSVPMETPELGHEGEEYVYDMTDLAAAIRRAILKLEDKDITKKAGFPDIVIMYKAAEFYWGKYYYPLPASQRIPFREEPTDISALTEAYLYVWGRLTTLRNPQGFGYVQALMEMYNIPPGAIPAWKERLEKEQIERELSEARERAKKEWLEKQGGIGGVPAPVTPSPEPYRDTGERDEGFWRRFIEARARQL